MTGFIMHLNIIIWFNWLNCISPSQIYIFYLFVYIDILYNKCINYWIIWLDLRGGFLWSQVFLTICWIYSLRSDHWICFSGSFQAKSGHYEVYTSHRFYTCLFFHGWYSFLPLSQVNTACCWSIRLLRLVFSFFLVVQNLSSLF